MSFDLGKDKVQYVVSCSHLDTQWRWTFQQTVDEYIPATMRENFALFEKFPDYVVSFEGAWRYMLMQKHYPAEYARVKEYVAKGNWAVVGSMLELPDVLVASPESLIRQILYGNLFFEKEFGKRNIDIFLPDCFGFGASLPTIGAHCGLKGFSTQKLITWRGGSYTDANGEVQLGIPFSIGVWEGVDGSSLIAAIDPAFYVGTYQPREEKIEKQGQQSGVWADYHYIGVGDRGGGLAEKDVKTLMDRVAAGPGSSGINVISAAADRLYKDLTDEQVSRLSRYRGELLCTQKSGGFYTSQAKMKWWNRRLEQLADATERMRVMTDCLGLLSYPRIALHEAWIRFLWHQMHDDLTGTSVFEAYDFSSRDYAGARDDFQTMLHSGVKALCRELNTQVQGTPCVVFNALSVEREDIVTVTVSFAEKVPASLRVFGAEGVEVPSETVPGGEKELFVSFLTRVPACGIAVYDIREADVPCCLSSDLRVDSSGLENSQFTVRIDGNGDICSVFDKKAGRELLSAPARLELLFDHSPHSPAWDILWEDISMPPRECVAGPVKSTVLANGPLRARLRIERTLGSSKFVQVLQLAAGAAGDRLDVATTIDWQTHERLLKASFPLAAVNTKAVYDLGLGVVERGVNSAKMHEVPAQQWAAIVDKADGYAVTILNDCKYGWDRPEANRLRLTLLHTPKSGAWCPEQCELEIGQRHEIQYSITGGSDGLRQSEVCWKAARLNQPLEGFCTVKHSGKLGRELSFLRVNTAQVMIMAVKKAERSDDVIVRLRELEGRPADVRITFAANIVEAHEVDGQELPLGAVRYAGNSIECKMKAYQPRTFAVRFATEAK